MNNMETKSYVEFESVMTRAERVHRRLWLALIMALVVLGVSNGVWFWMLVC